MIYTFETSGGIKLAGCASDISIIQNFPYSFKIGSIVFVKNKAKMGKLEKVAIKKVNKVAHASIDSGCFYGFNYVDTLNRVWLERELIWQAEAVELAIEFYNEQTERAIAELKRQGCA